ncbi:stage II sporulation protein P [Paenibacillus sp. ACRRX]|uniref:stage II sporulation protein P n=1 Tax=Paenibacillus sp. ACRRX TaxID=2918206 RepID=UPI001EF46B81|nr:stage II sporulation protein P [Paenibacillus sp. ACRRX]MCG7407883.1 stage II sporulation protein P [Paenibacillus sp. ACRRX]
MKPTVKWIDIARFKRKWLELLTMGRTFLLMALASAVFIVVIGVGGILEQRLQTSPLSSMKGAAAQISTQWFANMLAMEMPTMESSPEKAALSRQDVAHMLVRLVTNVNPLDPKTLLAGEMPGVSRDTSVPLRLAIGNQAAKGPEEFVPAPGEEDGAEHGGAPEKAHDDEKNGDVGQSETDKPDSEPVDESAQSSHTDDEVVFIYHSHNRESWKPELEKQTDNPNDDKKNITLVGKRLQEQLKKQGIGALHSSKDYVSTIQGYNWNFSYKYSNQTVKKAMSNNKNLKFFFDIHRDSARRKDTTVTIKGKAYAQVYFVIGHRNPNWKENEQFAADIHEKLEAKYPGISRGIWGKAASKGTNGEYNQSLSPNSVIIEVGGIENTLTESNRTADVLAELIAEVIKEQKGAKPVTKPISKPLNKPAATVSKQTTNNGNQA